jgi:hypothetical protein
MGIILKGILKKRDVMACTGFIWLRVGTNSGLEAVKKENSLLLPGIEPRFSILQAIS